MKSLLVAVALCLVVLLCGCPKEEKPRGPETWEERVNREDRARRAQEQAENDELYRKFQEEQNRRDREYYGD